MSLPIRFLAEAREEFDRATDWYRKRGKDLAIDFVTRIHAKVDRVAISPKMHAIVRGKIRKAIVSRFPYIVLHCEDAGNWWS